MVRERDKRNVKSTVLSFSLHLLPFDESNYRPVSVDRSRQQPRDHTELRSVGRHVESVTTRSYSCSRSILRILRISSSGLTPLISPKSVPHSCPLHAPPFIKQPSKRALLLSHLLNIPPACHHLLPRLSLLSSLHRYTHVAIISFPSNARFTDIRVSLATFARRHLGPTILQSIRMHNRNINISCQCKTSC